MPAPAAAAAPLLRRAAPRVQKLFRNGTLYQPEPPAAVTEHILNKASAPASYKLSQYTTFYHSRPALDAATTTTTPPSGIIGADPPSIICALNDGGGVLSQPRAGGCLNSRRPGNQRPGVHDCSDVTFDARDGRTAMDRYSAEEEADRRRRLLTVLFTWLGAKDRYAYKYIDLWTRRGHAVLHVTCPIRSLLMPKTGAEVTAQHIKNHIASLQQWRVVVHGLSVGGYITQLVLRGDDPEVNSKISHQIYDSFTSVEGLPEGVENAVPPRYSSLAKSIGKLYMKYADLSSFENALDVIIHGKAESPVFFMHSLADRVSTYERIKPLIAAMQRKTPVDVFLVPLEEQVPHVGLLKRMGPDTYMDKIETFLEHHKDPLF